MFLGIIKSPTQPFMHYEGRKSLHILPYICITHLANGPWNKSLNFIFPTKYVIPKSLKFSHWPSKINFDYPPKWLAFKKIPSPWSRPAVSPKVDFRRIHLYNKDIKKSYLLMAKWNHIVVKNPTPLFQDIIREVIHFMGMTKIHMIQAKWNHISPTDRFPWKFRGPISFTITTIWGKIGRVRSL